MVDLCATATVTVPSQTNPADYTYISSSSFTAAYTYTSLDSTCVIEYACTDSTASDEWCTLGSFNTSTGAWTLTLTTSDKSSYPPSVYSMTVTGSIVGHSS